MTSTSRACAAALMAGLSLLCLGGTSIPVRAEEPESYGDDYSAGEFGRIRYQENGVTISRAESDQTAAFLEPADINSPILPGDVITTNPDQRVEVQLALGALVRLDRGTEVTFLALPDPYAEVADHTVLQLGSGTMRVTVSPAEDEEFRIDTPARSIYLLGDADVRIEVSSRGRTRVLSWRGVVEVVGDSSSEIARSGMAIEVHPGAEPTEAYAFNTFASDGFDRWVEAREASYRPDRHAEDEIRAYRDIPHVIRPYYTELSHHGTWLYTDDYGYVWCPRQVSTTWRPYYDGYWSYSPRGYFWVSYEPWGWAPYHYGRWAWLAGHGWSWIPGRVFAGAWVSWSWGPSYVGWCPLDYWNRPIFVAGLHFGHYDPLAWTFVRYTHIVHRDYVRYSVNLQHVGEDLHRSALVTRPPRVSPRRLAESPEWRQRAFEQARGFPRAEAPGKERLPGRLDQFESRLLARGEGWRGSRLDRSATRNEGTRGAGGTGSPSRESAFPRRPSRYAADHLPRGRSAGRVSRPTGVTGALRGQERPQVQLRPDESSSTDRLRDIYRQMARPRPTREPSQGLQPGAEPRRGTEQDRSEKQQGADSTREHVPPPRPSAEDGRSRGQTGGEASQDKPKDSSRTKSPSPAAPPANSVPRARTGSISRREIRLPSNPEQRPGVRSTPSQRSAPAVRAPTMRPRQSERPAPAARAPVTRPAPSQGPAAAGAPATERPRVAHAAPPRGPQAPRSAPPRQQTPQHARQGQRNKASQPRGSRR